MIAIAQHFVHEYHGETTLHPLGLAGVIALGVAMLALQRRYAVWPMIVMACFIAPAQRIVILGADFDLLRLMALFGMTRVVMNGDYRNFRWSALDYAVIVFAVAHIIMGLIRDGPDILMNKLGYAYDAVGMYLLFRVLIRDFDDGRSATLGFSLIAVPVAAAFVLEMMTARNVFAVFGGVNDVTAVRDGRLRCQGAFAHPILAGVFWATLLPLLAVQWWDGRRRLAAVSCGAALLIIVACSSATPLTAVMFAGIGAVMFRYRYSLRTVRWLIVAALIGLHLVMKAPVWHLISRIDIVGGSSGYHRYQLIDGAIRHWHEWWLVGSRVGTAHWGHFTFDVTNTYIVQGLHGGITLLGIFVAMLAIAFRAVGRTWRAAGNRRELYWSWALGASLFAHATSFIAITYFGQITMLWAMLLAMIGSMEDRHASVRQTSAYSPATFLPRFGLTS